MGNCKVLIGRHKICEFLEIGKDAFYALIDDGMPVRKRGKRWVAHVDVLDAWFRTACAEDTDLDAFAVPRQGAQLSIPRKSSRP